MKKSVWLLIYWTMFIVSMHGMQGGPVQGRNAQQHPLEQAIIKNRSVVAKDGKDFRDAMPLEWLMHNDCKNNIVVCPFKLHADADVELRRSRQSSVHSLHCFSIAGNKRHQEKILEKFGERCKILLFSNNVDNYKKDPSTKKALIFFVHNGSLCVKKCDNGADHVKDSSLVIYNMPHYETENCLDWAYVDDLFDMLYRANVPCIVNCDSDVWKNCNPLYKIYHRFYGEKKVMAFNPSSQDVSHYDPAVSKMIGTMMLIGGLLCCYYEAVAMMSGANRTELSYRFLMT